MRKSCSFCRIGQVNDDNTFLVDEKLDFGILGEKDISVVICKDSEEKYFLQTAITDGTDLFYKNTVINFCPVCGRKLEKETD